MRLLICLLLLLTTHLSARIVECRSTKNFEKEIKKDTLVLFDVDDTTITTSSYLGSKAFFNHLEVKIVQWKLPEKAVLSLICKVIQKAAYLPAHKATPKLIAKLQEEGYLVFALTGRLKVAPWDPDFAQTTQKHLAAAGVDFMRTQLPSHFIDKKTPPSFAHGVIFSSWQPKGPVLKEFLQNYKHRPAKVVFIDDDLESLKSVEASMKEMKIPFVGFHYRHCEKKARPFDILTANIQLEHLMKKGVPLSDKAALEAKKKLLKKKRSINPDFYLDKLLSDLVEKQKTLR